MSFVDYITRAPKKNMTPAHVWGRAFAQENYYYQNLMRVKQEAQDFLATRGMSDESARLPQLSSTEVDNSPKPGSTMNHNHPLNEVRVYSRNEINLHNDRNSGRRIPPIDNHAALINNDLITNVLFNRQRERNTPEPESREVYVPPHRR